MTDQVIFNDNKPVEVKAEETVNYEEVLTPEIIELIESYKAGLEARNRTEKATIHVDEIASKIATLYEKIRKVVDWKEENVLRRSAILRILKRSFIHKVSEIAIAPKSSDINQIAENLTLELIRGGHLANDEVPTEKIEIVAKILAKYLYVLDNAPFHQDPTSFVLKKKVNFFDWLLEIAACEIEDTLAQPFKENALIKAMTLIMTKRIKLFPENVLDANKKKTLAYIAVCRTLFDLDDAFISYHMLTHHYPEWENHSDEFLKQTTNNIFQINEAIESDLVHPLSKDFFNICERIDTVFTLIGDLLDKYEKNPDEITKTMIIKDKFKTLLTEFYDKRVKSLKNRLLKLAIFSTLSVFMSNWATFLLVEIPLAKLLTERGFSLIASIADFMIPSIAMFILVILIRPPAGSNFLVALKTTFSFVYKDEEVEFYEIKTKKRFRPIFNIIIIVLYAIATIISFGVIGYLFYLAKIPITSVVFDTMTISLNVFAAMVIRNKSRELTVQERTGLGEFILDYLSVPIAEVGNFLGNKWKEYNVFTVFFNFVLELPFLSFVDFIENWSNFLKEKKADIH